MFTAIAPRYDFLNHLLSLNVDTSWRRQAVARLDWRRTPTGVFLDLCAGTLDLAAALADQRGFGGRVIGADFVLPMLQLGREKSDRVLPLNADALELPFDKAVFDGATVGFGVRNLADLDQGLAEAARVLKKGCAVRGSGIHHSAPGADALPVLLLLQAGTSCDRPAHLETSGRLHLPPGFGARVPGTG